MSRLSRPLPPLVPAGALLLALAAGAVAVVLLRDDPAPREDGRDSPAPVADGTAGKRSGLLPPALREALDAPRSAIRDRMGRAPAALEAIRAALPEDPALLRLLLSRLRTEIDLAIRSGHAESAAAAVRILRDALDAGGPPVRDLVDAPGFRPVWTRALAAESPETRAEAAGLLPLIGGPAGAGRAADLIGDGDPGVRAAAVSAYAALAGAPGAARLTAHAEREEAPGVRVAILAALASRADFRVPGAFRLERTALESGTAAERIQALQNLRLLADHDAADLVAANLDHDSADVRRQAARTLRRVGRRPAVSALEARRAVEEDERVREEIEAALDQLR